MRSLLFLMLPLLHFSPIHAQDLSGKWKGYFIANNDPASRIYTYELEVVENELHELLVVTYTNLSGNFYAKATATGIYSVNTGLVSIHENKFEDVNMMGNMQACLMMNFLTFTNIRGRGVLQGTYLSNNEKGNRDCGSGKVYLEKQELIKNKELLGRKKSSSTNAMLPTASMTPKNKKETTVPLKNNVKPDLNLNDNQNTLASSKLNLKQNSPNSSLVGASNQISTTTTNDLFVNSNTNKVANPETMKVAKGLTMVDANASSNEMIKKESSSPATETPLPKKLENDQPGVNNGEMLPWVLLGRENKLIKRVVTSSKKISLDLYDNGTIDNDTIIIYDNNKVIANLQRLSYKPIHINLEFSSGQHDIIIVAHNMGSVPPNTALVVFNDANLRQEFFITTTNKVNAKFEFVYKPIE